MVVDAHLSVSVSPQRLDYLSVAVRKSGIGQVG